jgi:hypothetical protein
MAKKLERTDNLKGRVDGERERERHLLMLWLLQVSQHHRLRRGLTPRSHKSESELDGLRLPARLLCQLTALVMQRIRSFQP